MDPTNVPLEELDKEVLGILKDLVVDARGRAGPATEGPG